MSEEHPQCDGGVGLSLANYVDLNIFTNYAYVITCMFIVDYHLTQAKVDLK